MNSPAQRLSHWISRRCSSQQWLVDRHGIAESPCNGLRPRILLSRELCLHVTQNLERIPAGKRRKAIEQQLPLLSPFPETGHYLAWQGSRAQLWLWDKAALRQRLPASERHAVIPDSALSLARPGRDGERLIAGLHGIERQHWRNGQLLDSHWQAQAGEAGAEPLDLSQRTPLQPGDRQLIQHAGLAASGAVLLAALLIQAGAWLDLHGRQSELESRIAALEEGNQLQAQARRRTLQSREQWQQRQQLLAGRQSELLDSLTKAMPDSAGLWQRYNYQGNRLQIFLRDENPDPRDYVTRLGTTGLLDDIQVQLDPRNAMLTLQATPQHRPAP